MLRNCIWLALWALSLLFLMHLKILFFLRTYRCSVSVPNMIRMRVRAHLLLLTCICICSIVPLGTSPPCAALHTCMPEWGHLLHVPKPEVIHSRVGFHSGTYNYVHTYIGMRWPNWAGAPYSTYATGGDNAAANFLIKSRMAGAQVLICRQRPFQVFCKWS